eukprot:NODE_18980_length_865_cov_5.119241.p1 GENE.NODE_18980_length_865_cov_5.119241~~NODE_18980_length_865_cov_5.119241.p1  ORF type:complete len:259 (-),score=72.49 NODE_18980_length_865_cov_5.119241:88-780(-)
MASMEEPAVTGDTDTRPDGCGGGGSGAGGGDGDGGLAATIGAVSPAASSSRELAENEFVVDVVKRDVAYEVGLSLSLIDGRGLLVHQVRPGLIAEWNQHNATIDVKRYSCIVEVNRCRGQPKEMLEAIKRDMSLSLVIRRCRALYVDITREQDGCRELGLVFDYRPGNATLLVTHITSGLVSTWNDDNPTEAVQEHDYIVVVNGICGSAFLMLGVIKGKDNLKMLVLRMG